jgi:predicted Zn-dependent protease
LLRLRARVYFQKGSLKNAEYDILQAGDLAPQNPEVLLDTAKIWTASGKNLDQAYMNATAVVKNFPMEIDGWDTLAMVVWKTEGTAAAAEILERVGGVAGENSALFQHLGDIRAELGNRAGAIEAYERALGLSDDGLSCGEKCLERKIKSVKR